MNKVYAKPEGNTGQNLVPVPHKVLKGLSDGKLRYVLLSSCSGNKAQIMSDYRIIYKMGQK